VNALNQINNIKITINTPLIIIGQKDVDILNP
jgi:hypothetical protein